MAESFCILLSNISYDIWVIIIIAEINEIKISYEVEGNGQPIIMLHGWEANKNTFNKLKEKLIENFKVYIIDLPGFGDTKIDRPYTVHEVAEIIHDFILKLSIIKPILLTHSYGGRIGIIYASKYDVDKLILISSAGVRKKLSLVKRIRIKLYKLLKKLGIKINIGSKDFKNSDPIKKTMLINAVNTDLKAEMNRIKCPTLLIYGENDQETPLEIAKIINKNINNSALITIDNCGHFPYLERLNYTLLIIKSFLCSE